MRFCITGVGLWARGLTSYAAFEAAAACGFSGIGDAAFEPPRPSHIPARERRRAGLLINLAVEVAHQACEHAGVDKASTASVFSSSMGDTTITDYMCRKLAGTERLLSPAKFTNSVHNAASGYWGISAGSRAPSTFVGGFEASFGAGLLEAISQAKGFGGPVLLVAYDVENSSPLADVCEIGETLGVALVVEAERSRVRNAGFAVPAELRFVGTRSEFPVPRACGLAKLAGANPMGPALVLLECCIAGIPDRCSPLRFPATTRGCIELQFLDKS